jgi:hypothetical protein
MPTRENEISQGPIVAKSRGKKSRRDELLDELLKEYGGSAGVTGPEGLLKDMTRAVINRAMGAELVLRRVQSALAPTFHVLRPYLRCCSSHLVLLGRTSLPLGEPTLSDAVCRTGTKERRSGTRSIVFQRPGSNRSHCGTA